MKFADIKNNQVYSFNEWTNIEFAEDVCLKDYHGFDTFRLDVALQKTKNAKQVDSLDECKDTHQRLYHRGGISREDFVIAWQRSESKDEVFGRLKANLNGQFDKCYTSIFTDRKQVKVIITASESDSLHIKDWYYPLIRYNDDVNSWVPNITRCASNLETNDDGTKTVTVNVYEVSHIVIDGLDTTRASGCILENMTDKWVAWENSVYLGQKASNFRRKFNVKLKSMKNSRNNSLQRLAKMALLEGELDSLKRASA